MIILYKCSCEVNVVDKSQHMKLKKQLNGTFRDSVSVSNVTVRVENNGDVDFNYAFIPEFNRYYFIDDIIVVNNKLADLVLTVDVLMTYKKGIYGLKCFVERNEHDYNELLIDKKRIIEQGIEVSEETIVNDFFTNGKALPDNEILFSMSGYKLEVDTSNS